MLFMALLARSAARTICRENIVEPYLTSSSEFWLASLSSVSVTCMAFFEVHSVITIIIPAPSSIRKLAGASSSSPLIIMFMSPDCEAILYESIAATGTPMKFTRSFPANASASENVPARIVVLRMFTPIRCRMKSIIVHATSMIMSDTARLAFMNSITAVSLSGFLSPL